MHNTIKLFPTLIYKDYYKGVDRLNKSLLPKLESIFEQSKENNNIFMRKGTLCSYHTSSDLHKLFPEETKEVVEFVESCARKYWQECGYYQELEPFLYQLWANKTPRDGYIDSHLHGNMPFTGVLYLDASPNQGNIFLENPLETLLMTQPISPEVKYPMGEEINVNSGDLIMFPGYLRHSVRPNLTDTPRLILAFNIGCRGTYWSSQWNKG